LLEQRQYLQATAKHSRFKDAALAAQELAAAEEEEETTAMMFALLQEQHKAQLESMVAANKQAMDAIFECMNVLIAGHGKAADVGTLDDVYIRNVPLPRAPQIQSASHMTSYKAITRDTSDTCYSQVTCVPIWSNLLRRSLAGLGRCTKRSIYPFSPVRLL
jgi:hypothetical protein